MYEKLQGNYMAVYGGRGHMFKKRVNANADERSFTGELLTALP